MTIRERNPRLHRWPQALRKAAERAVPTIEGTISVDGLVQPVKVIRDRWGTPHIYAQNLHDLFFAQGFVVASERLFQIDVTLRSMTGRLADLVGPKALPADKVARNLGWHRAGLQNAKRWDERSQEIFDAWIRGLHAWIDRMPAAPIEYVMLDSEPKIPKGTDAVGQFASSMDFPPGWISKVLRSEVAERIGDEGMLSLFPDQDPEANTVMAGKQGAFHWQRSAGSVIGVMPPPHVGLGSNCWVISGRRSETGKPLLAGDPHMAVSMPVFVYECHLTAPGFEVSGVCFPTLPGVAALGHTPRIAWGWTNLSSDIWDLYVEKLNAEKSAALYMDQWEPMTRHLERIEVRGQAEPETLEVLESRHGPLIDLALLGENLGGGAVWGTHEALALKRVEGMQSPSILFNMASATNFAEFREAARPWHWGVNLMYADVDGNIGYQCAGAIPNRRRGNGTVPVPGWTDEYEWDGFVAFDDLPYSLNPETGYLVTANQRVHHLSYPKSFGAMFSPPHRANRIAELITAIPKHSINTFREIFADTVSVASRGLLPYLRQLESSDPKQEEALAYLNEWKGDVSSGSVGASIYQLWCQEFAETVLLPRLGPELFRMYARYAPADWESVLINLVRYPTAAWFGADGTQARDMAMMEALGKAIDKLSSRLGRSPDGWRWGRLHQLQLDASRGLIPDEAGLLVGGVWEIGGNSQTVNVAKWDPTGSLNATVVSNSRHIFDMSDADKSVAVILTGQSGHPASPHWNDMAELWARGDFHPVPLNPDTISSYAEGHLTMNPMKAR
jgi:penicillin amidase